MRSVFLLVILLAGPVGAVEPLTVYTVNYPLQYFAERIGGDRVRAVYPGPSDRDPALWSPSREILRQYRSADLVILNGAGYAKWVEGSSLPHSRVVDSSAVFREDYLQAEASPMSGQNSHDSVAVTTWLDLYQAVQQAEAIMQALADRRPQHKTEFEENFQTLRDELMRLDLALQKLSAEDPVEPLFVAQTVYQYMARRYRIHLQGFDWAPAVMPSEEQWQRLVYAQGSFPARWMIWEAAPNEEIRARLKASNVQVIVFNTCATASAQGDFVDCMRDNVAALERAFH
jgi:zinc transport system substrate-binding protein